MNSLQKHNIIIRHEIKCFAIIAIISFILFTFKLTLFCFLKNASILFDSVLSFGLIIISLLNLYLIKHHKSKHHLNKKYLYFDLIKTLFFIIIYLIFLIEAIVVISKDYQQNYLSQELLHYNWLYILYFVFTSIVQFGCLFFLVHFYKKISYQSKRIKFEIKTNLIVLHISLIIALTLLISNEVTNNHDVKRIIDKSVTIAIICINLPFAIKQLYTDAIKIKKWSR